MANYMYLRGFVQRHGLGFLAYTETDSILSIYATRRGALKAVKEHFDKLGGNYVFQLTKNLGI